MKKYLILFIFCLFFMVAGPVSAACPGGLSPVWTTGLPICAKVYQSGEALPVGCPESLKNNLIYIECHPELHGSYKLEGQIISGDCNLFPPGGRAPNNSIYPACGWILDGNIWKWNGPGPTPSTPPPPLLSGQNYACWGIESVLAGSPVYTLEANGSVSQMSSEQYLSSHASRLGFFMQLSGCSGWEQFGNSGSGSTPTGQTTPSTQTPGAGSAPYTSPTVTPGGAAGTIAGQLNAIQAILTSLRSRGVNPAIGPDGAITGTPVGGEYDEVINIANNAVSSIMDLVSGRSRTGTSPTTNTTSKPAVQSGLVTISVGSLNIRSAPNTDASVLGRLTLGQTFVAVGWVEGESVETVNKWWKDAQGRYIWSGGTKEQPSGTALAN